MFDLDTRAEIPIFAELDAWPEAEDPALLIRPQVAMTVGHRVGVAMTGRLTVEGSPFSMPGWSEAEAELYAELAALEPDTQFGWAFPIGSPTRLLEAELPAVPSSWSLTEIDSDASPGVLPDGIWRKLEGTIRVSNYLVDDTHMELAEGVPTITGEVDAELHVYFPDSLREAAPGSVPVLLFGHGILSYPDRYLDEADSSGVVAVANRLGAIVVATTWRGLTIKDNLHAVQVAGDFCRVYEITEMLGQGVMANLALTRALTEGMLLDDPLFRGLADKQRFYYYGISLGGIEGSVLMAAQEKIGSPFLRAVLHVAGSAWSTMLERSSNWAAFESVVSRSIPDPYERQKLYAASQLFWDMVDPASYTLQLQNQSLLYQESIGDEQVPNITTELLIRSLQFPLAEPAATAPYGFAPQALPTTASVLVQFDPELPLPEAANRPAEVTGAHGAPRQWEGAIEQTWNFLNTGEIRHFCGDGYCSDSNQGQP
jgi:hypothetical protein